jgi:predicted NAD/FAD-dependent oxidoreductase
MKIAVLGAGISGLVCARHLVGGGHEVTVLEKSRSLGGRCATRKFGEHVVDTGAQYFTVRDPIVRKEIEQVAGVQFKKITQPILIAGKKGEVYREGEERFYIGNGNNRLGAMLADGLEIRKETEVGAVTLVGKEWEVAGDRYDVVVSSAPWPQSARILGRSEAGVGYEPNLTALLEYRESWSGSEYAQIDPTGQDPLRWVACENAKVGRVAEGSTVYVIQASADYSRENLEKKPEEWVGDLQGRLEKAWGLNPERRGQVMSHRWRYARREKDSGHPVELPKGLYLCGDSEVDSRVESVWRSGKETAEKILGSKA